jgi:hypothetical protein
MAQDAFDEAVGGRQAAALHGRKYVALEDVTRSPTIGDRR